MFFIQVIWVGKALYNFKCIKSLPMCLPSNSKFSLDSEPKDTPIKETNKLHECPRKC